MTLDDLIKALTDLRADDDVGKLDVLGIYEGGVAAAGIIAHEVMRERRDGEEVVVIVLDC